MRPRLFTAENRATVVMCRTPFCASMRPRLFTAENGSGGDHAERRGSASMRPRLFTAENAVSAGIETFTEQLQ